MYPFLYTYIRRYMSIQEPTSLYKRLDLYIRGYISMLGPLGCQIYDFVIFVWFYNDLLISNVKNRCFCLVFQRIINDK